MHDDDDFGSLGCLVILIVFVVMAAGAYFGTVEMHSTIVEFTPKYHYEGSGEFGQDKALEIYKKMSDGGRQAPVDLLPNGKVFVMYSFDDSKPNKFGLMPTKENTREDAWWLYIPCVIAVLIVEAIIVLVIVAAFSGG